MTEVTTYDFGPGTLLSDKIVYYGQSWNGGTGCNAYGSGYIHNTPCYTAIKNPSGTLAQTQITYSNTGHPTSTSKWVSGSTWLTTTAAYNPNGTVQWTKDTAGNQTSFAYTGGCNSLLPTSITHPLIGTEYRTWYCNGGVLHTSEDVNSQITTYTYNDPYWRETLVGYPDGGSTSTTYNTKATLPWSISTSTVMTTSSNLNKTTIYDGIGRETQAQLTSDPAGIDYVDTTYDLVGRKATVSNPHRSASSSTDGITTYSYDAVDRVTLVNQADGSQSGTTYSNNCTTVTDEAGHSRKSCVDGMGRPTGVWEDPGSSPHLNYETDYAYDALSNLLTVTQKGGAGSGWRVRSFLYDGLTRLTSATNPESGTLAYAYSGCSGDPSNICTKTAPSPNQPVGGPKTVTTTYTYDTLNRLTGKSYVDGYNSNPATPPVTYGYDGVALSCPMPVAFVGTSGSNVIGRRSAMCYAAGNKSWTFDPMGRVDQENDRLTWIFSPYSPDVTTYNGIYVLSENTQYAYYLNGDLNEVLYPGPDGPPDYEFYTGENAAGQVTSAGDIYFNVLQNATYTPTGQLATALVGAGGTYSGSTISNTYNNRLQPVLVSASTASSTSILNLTYNFNVGNGNAGSGTDNGNVIQITNGKDSNRTQNFLYDPLNRLWQAYTNGPNWGETYSPSAYAPGTAFSSANAGIDAWGNLTNISHVTGKTNSESLVCAAANNQNQLNTCFTYDAAGNLIKDATATYFYDAENRIIATAGLSYVYDGDGNRVEKCTEGTTPGTCASSSTGMIYWLHTGGGTLAESDLGGNWTAVYGLIRGMIASRVDLPSKVVHYYFHDHLNSTNVVTDGSGNIQNESDFYPYGGELVISSGDSNRYKFTGKERDTESCSAGNCLDNFGARYFASSMGRFMSPDWAAKPVTVPYAHFGDPQTLNLYAYVENGPVNRVDADGHNWGVPTLQQIAAGFESEYEAAIDEQIEHQPPAQTTQTHQGGSCGFFCKLFHTDHTPAKEVILNDKTQNKGSYSLFYYQLENKEGQKLTGNGYGVEEHISPSSGTTTSEGRFVPADNGVSQDMVGLVGHDANGQPRSVTPPTSPDADFVVQQTFTVRYKGNDINLSTQFQHETQIKNGVVTNTVTDIGP